LYTQVQVSEVLHSSKGNRGASLDKNRVARRAWTASQHCPLGLMATACHWLDVRTATARFAKDLDLFVPLVFSDTGALLLGHSRYATSLRNT
jgi:hypothetical protein